MNIYERIPVETLPIGIWKCLVCSAYGTKYCEREDCGDYYLKFVKVIRTTPVRKKKKAVVNKKSHTSTDLLNAVFR